MRQITCRLLKPGPLSLGALSIVAVAALAGYTLAPVNGAAGCTGLANTAFCDTFDQGPTANRGRAGDLDPAKWSGSRISPSDFSGSVADPAPAAPIPACRSSLPISLAWPPDDTLICDATATRSRQLMVAAVMQNYGNYSYMIRQPFDFANRTGKIVFDVEAASVGNLGAWVEINITDEPIPAPVFREYENFEPGPVPRNGLMIKFNEICANGLNRITPGNVMVYRDYAPTIITPTFSASGSACAATRQGSLNHFEISVSQGHLEVYGSDYSLDDGNTFPNLHRLYAADLTVPFTRGYVHVGAHNHATVKYGFGLSWIFHWDNIGFDGPVINNWRAYEVANNGTNGTNQGRAIHNLGYQLSDGTGRPAGMYDPVNRVPSLTLNGVDLSGIVGAKLALNSWFNTVGHTATTSWGISFRFNGGTWRNHALTSLEVGMLNIPGSAGNLALALDVPLSDLRSGTNTLEFVPFGAPMDWVPAIANIDLILTQTTAPPLAPNNLRIIR